MTDIRVKLASPVGIGASCNRGSIEGWGGVVRLLLSAELGIRSRREGAKINISGRMCQEMSSWSTGS